jgi:cyclic-di-GMP-binding protein
MNTTVFKLPAVSRDQPPAFADARGCSDWLAAQPLANAAQSQTQLLRQLNLLNRHAIAPGERLKILELLRDPIAYAQSESARKFAGRPLPLAPPEQAGMDANRALWQAVQTGYLHCLVACLEGAAELRPHVALIAQRVIVALRAELLDIYRAPVDPPAQLWQMLHQVFAAAEGLDALAHPVNDTLQTKHPATSVAAAYAQTLMLHRASPFELTARQLAMVERWLHRWGGKTVVLRAPPVEPRVPPLVVDIASDEPESAGQAAGGSLRWLDLSEFSRSIKRRIAHLQKGESPASLGLGEDCVQPGCELLLRQLYQQWFKGGAARLHQRRSGGGTCRLIGGADAIHYYISGKIFRQPGQGDAMSKHQADEIATFGRVATRHEEDYSQMHGYMIEQWRVLDESATGFRLSRPLSQAGGRIGGGQLVAVMPEGSRAFGLAVARWSRLTAEAEMQAGIQVMPGQPNCVALRGTGIAAVNEKYRPGFTLPPVPALHEPETVIVPAGWFRPGRIIELYDQSSRQIRLIQQIDRGSDFERCAFDFL